MTKPKAETPDGSKENKTVTDGKTEGPNEQIELANILKEYGVKPDRCANIAAHIVTTGGEDVLSSRETLTKALTEWSEEILPLRRKKIVDRWCALKLISPQDSHRGSSQTGTGGGVDDAGADLLFSIKDDAAGEPQVVAVQGDKEQGTTYAKANAVCQQMKKDREGRGVLLIESEESGKFIPNMKNSYVQSNLSMMQAYAKQTNEALGREIPPDMEEQALQEMERSKEKAERWRNVMGGGGNAIDDAVKLVKGMQELSGGAGKPAADPQLQQNFQALTAQVQKQGDDMTTWRHQQELAEKERVSQQKLDAKDREITGLRTEVQNLRTTLQGVADQVGELKGRPGKTAYDLLGDIFHKLPDRTDLREIALQIAGKDATPSSRSGDETRQELDRLAGAMETAANLTEAGEWIFGKG